jgi:hypothetical protein
MWQSKIYFSNKNSFFGRTYYDIIVVCFGCDICFYVTQVLIQYEVETLRNIKTINVNKERNGTLYVKF